MKNDRIKYLIFFLLLCLFLSACSTDKTKGENETLKQQVTTLTHENDSTNIEIKKISEKLDEITKANETLNAKIIELTKANEELKSKTSVKKK